MSVLSIDDCVVEIRPGVKMDGGKVVEVMENYLQDVLQQLIEEAVELKANVNSQVDEGELLAYYKIISRLLNQAEAFGISGKISKELREFVPESLLEALSQS